MRKFIKYGMIAGFVLILAGTGIATAAFAVGASPKRIGALLEERFHLGVSQDGIRVSAGDHSVSVGENGLRISSGEDGVDVWDGGVRVSSGENGLEADENGVRVSAGDRSVSVGENGVRISKGDGEGGSRDVWFSPGTEGGFEAGYPVVTELEIHQNGGKVEIYTLEEIEELTVKSKNGSLEQLGYKDSEMKSSLTVNVKANEEYQIFIPASWEFDSFEAEVKGGALSGNGIRAYDTELHTAGGAVSMSQKSGAQIELECSGGAVKWDAAEEMAPELKAECKGGTIAISFPDSMDSRDFGYEIECEGGSVKVPEFSIDGREKREVPGNTGMPYLKLEVSGGEIGVNQ